MGDMSASAAFFYNTSVQRPDKLSTNRKPSQYTNLPITSSAQPVKHIFNKSATSSVPLDARTTSSSGSSRGSKRSRSYSSGSNRPTTTTTTTATSSEFTDRMINSASTPLSSYKRALKSGKSNTADGNTRLLSRTTSGTATQDEQIPGSQKHAASTVGKTRSGILKIDSNNGADQRAASLSSTSNTASTTGKSGGSGEMSGTMAAASPFTRRHGRRYLRDSSNPYPLPCDLTELHRQTLKTMLQVQVFGSPVCSPNFQSTPPKRVLEVACGTGYWSSLCHQHFSRQGHRVSFTGTDIACLAPDLSTGTTMDWRFVQHDLRSGTLPFSDEEFDLVMLKDMSLVIPESELRQALTDEFLRVLRPGGSLEVWESDHTLRTLVAHHPQSSEGDDSDSEDEDEERANVTGTYVMTQHTPFAAPQNQYLVDYNTWIAKALEDRKLPPMPCTHVRPQLLQESEHLTDIDFRRLAIPLSEIRWEREGVGVGKSSARSSGSSAATNKSGGPSKPTKPRVLTTAQLALRRTALLLLTQMIESLEPVLREASGKGQDEWDRWVAGMMSDLLVGGGTSWGECFEIGAWWAKKKAGPGKRSSVRAPGRLNGTLVTGLGGRPMMSSSGASPTLLRNDPFAGT